MEPVFDYPAFVKDVINTAVDAGGAMHDWIFSIDNCGHLCIFSPEMDRDVQEEISNDVENVVRHELNLSFPLCINMEGPCALHEEYSIHRGKFRDLGQYAGEVCFCWMRNDDERELMECGRYLAFKLAANL